MARDHVAEVAVTVMLGGGHDGRTYDVTGPMAISLREAAEKLSGATAREVAYHPETIEEAYGSRSS